MNIDKLYGIENKKDYFKETAKLIENKLINSAIDNGYSLVDERKSRILEISLKESFRDFRHQLIEYILQTQVENWDRDTLQKTIMNFNLECTDVIGIENEHKKFN